MTNILSTIVEAGNNPKSSGFDPEEHRLPTREELGLVSTPGLNNFNPNTADPTNLFIFDCNEKDIIDFPDGSTSEIGVWSKHISSSGEITIGGPNAPFYYSNNIGFKPDSYRFFKNDGPRDLGYMKVQNRGWLVINDNVDIYDPVYDRHTTIVNAAWLQGSMEMSIRPESANCTIVSGLNLSRTQEKLSQMNTADTTSGKSVGLTTIELSQPGNTTLAEDYAIYELEISDARGPQEEYAMAGQLVYTGTPTGGFVQTVDPESGLSLTPHINSNKYMALDIVDGCLQFTYKILYGDNEKTVVVKGSKNIYDGNWHHVVINRPSQYTMKTPGTPYGGKGCIEIWVDGQLDKRSYEITSDDIIPTPQLLFNDAMNPAILNWRTAYAPDWLDEYALERQYLGDIREFILRQTFALTPDLVNKNYTYSILNTQSSTVNKVKTIKVDAELINPVVSVNKKTVLKLYWNNLIKDKTKILNGLEFDETYNVRAYSVTHKNLINDTQTFNIDLTAEQTTRKFLPNVRVAINQSVYIFGPSLMPFSTLGGDSGPVFTPGFGGPKMIFDMTNNAQVQAETYSSWHLQNILYGGVNLNKGDRILLINQYNPSENGVWIFNGGNVALSRATDVSAPDMLNAHVFVEEGTHANTTFIQTQNVKNLRRDTQRWRQIDNDSALSTLQAYPIHTSPWSDLQNGNQRFIDVNTDIDFDYDIIAFMNYPTESKEVLESMQTSSDVETKEKYSEFIANLRVAVDSGKSLYISSPLLAVDFGIANQYVYVDQLLNKNGDAQSASISPFESGEPAEYYFDTHRNMKYHLATEFPGLTDKETYVMSDIVTYSPDKINSDYHIKYNYRQFGLQEGDEFIIPGLTTVPETINSKLPGYIHNQRGIGSIAAFPVDSINMGVAITKFGNLIYDGETPLNNPYDDYISTIAVEYGFGKIFVNCVENGYAFSRSDYNTAKIQNVVAGENAETVETAAWQYSTKRLNKKNFYDFSDISNLIGQTTPTDGGGGALIQAQSHCSNGIIRKNTNKGDLKYQSDLYSDFTEEIFEITEIPVRSMTWLGLQWLAE